MWNEIRKIVCKNLCCEHVVKSLKNYITRSVIMQENLKFKFPRQASFVTRREKKT